LLGPWTALRAQSIGSASDQNFHTWYMYFGDHPVKGGPWGIHFDGQWRRQGIGEKWQQLLLRPGVNYDLNSKVQVSGGYAFIKTHRYGEFPAEFVTPEHRLWEQVLVKHTAGRARLSHRFRVDQRFVGVKGRDQAGNVQLEQYSYRNRFRYFVKAVVPFSERPDYRYFLSLYNEVMFNWGRNVQNNTFDQNRAYIALGRRLPGFGNIEIGYLQQTVQQGNGRIFEFNHTLQVGLFSVLPFGGS
jgi:hypothetical protein